jgi:hypothetical protein
LTKRSPTEAGKSSGILNVELLNAVNPFEFVPEAQGGRLSLFIGHFEIWENDD